MKNKKKGIVFIRKFVFFVFLVAELTSFWHREL